MLNRRQFLKSLLVGMGAASLPMIVKASQPEPDFPFHDIGPRGLPPLSEQEQQLVKKHMQEYLGTDDIHWQIPGKRDHCQGVAIMEHKYVVTWKPHPRSTSSTIYIEVERTS